MAPEMMAILEKKAMGQKLDKKNLPQFNPFACDLFSIGMTMLCLTEPKLKRDKMEDYLESGFYDDFPELYKIVAKLLDPEPHVRTEVLDEILKFNTEGQRFQFTEENYDKFRKYQY
mmetsp:Transcript_32624/g.29499  ORF Transcript_32624/g.29499 Transcript_32624/m.29499 type:complete len:116 (-) Transcript_32624:1828-2175(-)